MVIIFLICSLCIIAYLTGMSSARLIRFTSAWYQTVCIPFIVLLAICLIYKAPWYWLLGQFILQIVFMWVGVIYQKTQFTNFDIERLEKIGDLGLKRWVPAGVQEEQVAIVLMDVGAPASIDQVKPFMRRFFNDTHVFRFPLIHSWFAYFFVNDRLDQWKEQYELIGGVSPMGQASLKQVDALNEEFQKRGRKFKVFLSFNYAEPLPSETLLKIKESGQKYILPLSLYPQQSFSTTEAHILNLQQAASKVYPEVHFLQSYSYHLYEGYIQALVDRIHESINANENLNDFYLLFSAQGSPSYFLEEGDQYSYAVSQTVAAVLKKLGRDHKWSIAYQGAISSITWLEPSTENIILSLAQKAVKKVILVPVSFVTDRIETAYEIDIKLRELARSESINDFRLSKAIDCHPGFINALADCAERSLGK